MKRLFYLLAVLSFLHDVNADKSWVQGLKEAMVARDSILGKLEAFNTGSMTYKKIEDFVNVLDQFQKDLEGLTNLNDVTSQEDTDLTRSLLEQSHQPAILKYFKNGRIEKQFAERGLGHIQRSLKGFFDGLCVKKLFATLHIGPKSYSRSIPVETICRPILEDLQSGEDDGLDISNVCTSLPKCAVEGEDAFSDPSGTSIKEACVEETNACDVKKAVPIMTALLWYRVSNYIAQAYCKNVRADVNVLEHYTKHVELLQGYVSTLEWDVFFKKAFEMEAYKSLQEAMELVGEREISAKQATVACNKLAATKSCKVSIMYGQYEMLKKLKEAKLNPGRVRDIRNDANVDHRGRLNLRQAAEKHNQIMGGLTVINENIVQASVQLSDYFKKLAQYDEGIAQADVEYITGKIQDFNTTIGLLSSKVETDLRNAMIAMQVALSAQLVEEIVIMGAKIAEHLNPLKVIFGGVEAGDLYEQSAEIARATSENIKGIALLVNLDKLATDAETLGEQFNDNAKQIEHLNKVIDGIRQGDLSSVSFDSDKFIQEYGGYTPKVSAASIAKNDALWGAFKGATCDLLTGAQGIGASVPQAVIGGMLLCEKLEGTIAEYSTVRQNIFDFQFDLVDALAKVVRANLATKLAAGIALKNNQLEVSDLMISLFMNQYRLQSETALYCNRIEYRRQGRALPSCNQGSGLWTEEELIDIISYNDNSHYDKIHRFVYIPTRPSFPGDTGFINLPALARGDPVTFRLPLNVTCLIRHNWLVRGETIAPFVESFKLFLPLKEYGNQHRTTRIEVKSDAGSSVSWMEDVTYLLPKSNRKYVTVYNEGFTRCPTGKVISNPYSLCGNLPDICDTPERIPGSSLLPTILSTWSIKYDVSSAGDTLDWQAPDPATNLLIIGKLILRMHPDQDNKIRLSDGEPMVEGCCNTGNQYRPSWNRRVCEDCPIKPDSSTSKLGGYYCEKDSS